MVAVMRIIPAMIKTMLCGIRAVSKNASNCPNYTKFVIVGVMAIYRPFGKRFLDLLFVLCSSVVTVPMLAILVLLVRVRLGNPVFFCQDRPGLGGRIFRLWKLRTMIDARGLPDAQRLTPLGRRLRAWSLDELPELWNVLKGEMSLVGPRPLLVEYLPRYTREQMRRHEVRPGITGWAQVNGRNAIGWPEKFACDVWYVDHVSLWLDVKILAMTVWKTGRREGISHPGCATMPSFLDDKSVTVTGRETARNRG
jgi:sugar transferase EpsL